MKYSPYFKNPIKKKRYIRSKKFYVYKAKRWLRLVLTVLAVVVPASLIIYFGVNLHLFNISKVAVYGAQEYVNSADAYHLVESNLLGQNIFTANTHEVEQKLEEQFKGAKNITIKRVFPKTIAVYVEERVPLAIVQVKGGSYLIDEEGYMLGKVNEQYVDLPKIKYFGNVEIGGFISSNIITIARNIVDAANEYNVSVTSLSYKDRYTEMFVDGVGESSASAEVKFSNEKDAKYSMNVLASFLRNLELEGKKVKSLDLRYDKVIVLYD
jgi:cell division septal protein FtsQ